MIAIATKQGERRRRIVPVINVCSHTVPPPPRRGRKISSGARAKGKNAEMDRSGHTGGRRNSSSLAFSTRYVLRTLYFRASSVTYSHFP